MAVLILASLSLSATVRTCGPVVGVRLGSTSLAAFGTPANDPGKHPARYRDAMRRDAERGTPAWSARSAAMGRSRQA